LRFQREKKEGKKAAGRAFIWLAAFIEVGAYLAAENGRHESNRCLAHSAVDFFRLPRHSELVNCNPWNYQTATVETNNPIDSDLSMHITLVWSSNLEQPAVHV
jgi:hypothetical protein